MIAIYYLRANIFICFNGYRPTQPSSSSSFRSLLSWIFVRLKQRSNGKLCCMQHKQQRTIECIVHGIAQQCSLQLCQIAIRFIHFSPANASISFPIKLFWAFIRISLRLKKHLKFSTLQGLRSQREEVISLLCILVEHETRNDKRRY